MSDPSLPEYVERGGALVWRPPYVARNADVFGFLLRTDRAAIDQLLQRDLVEPSYGAVDYRAATDFVVVLVANIGRLSCADPPDSLRGFLPEREVGIWCLTADAHNAGRLAWYLPYVFTDSAQTVVTGREVYGYPKQIGAFDDGFPAALVGGGTTTISALANSPYEPAQVAQVLPMVSVETLNPLPPPGPLGTLAEFLTLFASSIGLSGKVPSGPPPQPSAIITAIEADAPPGAQLPPPWVRRILDRFGGIFGLLTEDVLLAEMVANPTLVFLKQFRDISCATKACYQAVTQAPFGVDPVGYQELDPSNFAVTVQDWASHPIASEIGLPASTPLTPSRAFRASLNFQIKLGYDVWRAGT